MASDRAFDFTEISIIYCLQEEYSGKTHCIQVQLLGKKNYTMHDCLLSKHTSLQIGLYETFQTSKNH